MSEKVNDICLFQNGFKCYPDILSFSSKAEILISKFEKNLTQSYSSSGNNKRQTSMARTKLNNIKSVEKIYKHFVFALYIDLFLSLQNSVLPAQDRKLGRFNKNAQRFLVIFKHVLSNRIQSYISISF